MQSCLGNQRTHTWAVKTALQVALVALPLFALFSPKSAHAYTWMIKHSYPSCTACHADPSGGELLTAYGRQISGYTLSTDWSGGGGSATNQRSLTRKLALRAPESFAAGAKAAGKNGDDAKADTKPADDAAATEESTTEQPAEETAAAEAPAASSSESGDDGELKFPKFLFGAFNLPDWLLLGGSYRHLNIVPLGGEGKFRTFPMMMDLYGQLQFGKFRMGGSIGGARVAAGSPYARRAQITTNQGKDWNLISRTHYLGYDITPELTLRAGRLNLPFGIRIPEHTMWVRQATNTDRESSQQHGVALAYTSDTLRGEVMAIAGNYQINPDKFRDRGYSGYLEYPVADWISVGVTSLYTYTMADRQKQADLKTMRQAHGLTARASFGDKIALLAEADGIFSSRRDPGYVGFVQLDTEFIQGVHLMATGEILDQGYQQVGPGLARPLRLAGDGKPKVGGWLSAVWFIYSHFDMRVDLLKRTAEDAQLLAQLHVYL
jgi:hypothetical protein